MDLTENAKTPLKETEALERSRVVSNVSYKLHISLQKKKTTFDGDITINFDLSSVPDSLFLDFNGKRIHSVKVNDFDGLTGATTWKDSRLHFAKDALRAGRNTVHISYTNDYAKHGEGLHHFVDPEDGEEYVYTNFEPFYANMWAPCFDQPDLRATLDLTVTAPADWCVIANSKPVSEPTKTDDGRLVHRFEETPKISTYLFAMVAGPFEKFTDDYDNGRIPLGFYCRKSLVKYLQQEKDELFLLTKQGLRFYEEFFDCKYPFSKYDQVFCPEYNQGAMENVGCVTYTEVYIFKDKPTIAQRVTRADTLLHEMAHMWFGNLVSPKWWNGLWLNESFATYMAALAVAEATAYASKSWEEFLNSMKAWAYREDQLSTTHPIEGVVRDTDETFLNFDGITYGKGAALLKQLVHVVGMDGFKTGMRYYFRTYAWGNTTIDQFLRALEHGAKQVGRHFDPVSWARMWLQEAGLNSLKPQLEVKDGKISSFTIQQFAPESHPTLRTHRVRIGLFDMDKDSGKIVLRKQVDADVQAQPVTQITSLEGEPQPDFCYINYDDHAYAKCLFDERSLAFALQHLEKFESALLRQLLWNDLFNCVRDAAMKSTDFLKLVKEKAGYETSSKLVQSLIARSKGCISAYLPSSMRINEGNELFKFFWNQLQNAKEEEWQIIWARALVYVAETAENAEFLTQYLEEGKKIAGNFELDQAMRWSVVITACSFNLPNAQKLLEAEEKRDPSDRGKRQALTAKTSFPSAEVKEQAWKRYTAKELPYSLHMMCADMSGFRYFHQRELVAPYIDKFFDVVRQVFKDQEREFARDFFALLFPKEPENDYVLKRSYELLEQLTDEETILKRTLKEVIDDLERFRKALALFKAN